MTDTRSFIVAMAAKPAHSQHLTDAQWYVGLVACCVLQEGLDSGDFKFTMAPPNPEIQACFDVRIPPLEAAYKLFAVRH